MRFVGSLRVGIQELKDYYEAILSDSEPGRLAHYPFPTFYKVGHEKYHFTYTQVLEGKCVFRARLQDGNPVVVKFARRYGVEAHQRAVALNIAPRLISSEWMYGWCMVVMEDISNSHETLFNARNRITHNSIPHLQKQVKGMLGRLHRESIVHGDIRSINVMIRKPDAVSHPQEFLIVDWDWAGREDQVRYPTNLNPVVKRPASVLIDGTITPAHDLEMAERLGSSYD